MARTVGLIGFGFTSETSPGVWDEQIVERKYRGELLQNSYRFQTTNQINDDINLSSRISIVADIYAHKNSHAMKYVEFMGVKWKITNIEVQHPRLILTVGGVWNGA